jgi:hypothetical protein
LFAILGGLTTNYQEHGKGIGPMTHQQPTYIKKGATSKLQLQQDRRPLYPFLARARSDRKGFFYGKI